MADKAKHAFGALERIDSAIASGAIDSYDILFVKDAHGKPYVGWVDKDGKKVIVQEEEKVVVVEDEKLPEFGEEGKVYIFDEEGYFWDGEKFLKLSKPTDLTGLEAEVAKKANVEEVEAKIDQVVLDTNAYTDKKIEAATNEHLVKKYEIFSKPDGTIVDYREKEIRVMCPVGTKWVKQNVGSNGNANMYYMGFKAYAPDGAVSFKEGDRGVIIDEMYTFDDDFAGTDKYGRNYSVCWFALATYDDISDTWTYFGENSSINKYIGWNYCVEWYDAKGVVIASDSIRINLSNEDCHFEIKPYYMADVSKEIDVKIEEKIDKITSFEIIEF